MSSLGSNYRRAGRVHGRGGGGVTPRGNRGGGGVRPASGRDIGASARRKIDVDPRQTKPRQMSPVPNELDLRMMRHAMQLAKRAAAEGEVPVGAVVYHGETIISEGWNTREATNDPTAHAELLAMREAGMKLEEWRLNECTLAVTLEPCPMCAGAMVNARLGRVFYGASDPKAGACESLYEIPTDNRLNHRVLVVGGVLAEECGDLLRDFFRRRRKENKARKAAGGTGCGCGSKACGPSNGSGSRSSR